MDKDFVPYQEALELKELGFDEPCLAFYNGKLLDGSYSLEPVDTYFIKFRELSPLVVKTPLYQQAFRWFRDKYKQDSLVVPSGDSTGKTNGYYYEIIFDFSKGNIESQTYNTYEEAELECLRKLIEIVEENDI